MRNQSKLIALSVSLALSLGSMIATAEEPNPKPAATQPDPVKIDRDGKKICGFDLMNDSERGGYRNMMHQTKALADRDAIRVDHCARMKERAQQRGVPLDE